MNRLLTSFALASLMMCSPAVAQQAPTAKPAAPAAVKPAAQPAKTDDKKPEKKPDAADPMKAMEEAWQKAGEVGPNHKLIAWFEGEWECEVKDCITPDAKPEKGKMTSKMKLGGRILDMNYEGRMQGKFFYGMGTMGYNNTTKKFESTWADSMSTATTFMTGTADAAGKVFTLTGECANPMGGSNTHEKWVMTITGKDSYKEEFYSDMMGGKEAKVMEITATRAGSEKPAKKDEAKPAEKPADKKPATKSN